MLLRKHRVDFHLYGNDCQIYVPIHKGLDCTVQAITDCLDEVRLWMLANFLGLNETKSEVIVFFPNGRMEHGLDLYGSDSVA